MESNPHLFSTVFDLAYTTQKVLIDTMIDLRLGRMGLTANVVHLRHEMGYEESPVLERLMIENVINCWMRLQFIELQISTYSFGDNVEMRQVQFWERRLAGSTGCLRMACETFARVRKLTRNTRLLQVNIATEHWGQVNIAGDVVKGHRN